MKNKIMLITIILLIMVIFVLVSLLVYQSNYYVKIPKQYQCESESSETEGLLYKQILTLNINKNQYIENYETQNISIYTDLEQYENQKHLENNDNVTYTFDDENKTVYANYNLEKLIDSENNPITIWYKDYIKNLELTGYECHILK